MFSLLFKNGKLKSIDEPSISTHGNEGVIWNHLDGDITVIKQWLASQSIDLQTIESLCEEHTRPRLFFNSAEQCVAMIRMMFQQDDGLELSSLRLLIVNKQLITISLLNSHLVESIKKELEERPRQMNSPEQLLWYLFQKATDGVSTSIIDIDEKLNGLEDASEDRDEVDINKLHQLRRDASKIKRFLAPQHDVALKVVAGIDDIYQPVADQKQFLVKWKNTSNGIKRDLESLTASIERLAILQEAINHQKQDSINQTMYVLSLVATFFLPLTFVASILGMNVKGIPYENHPYAFTAVCTIMVVIMTTQFFLFKRWRWIK